MFTSLECVVAPASFQPGTSGMVSGERAPADRVDTLLDSGLMPTHISSTTDQDGVPPEDASHGEESNETETLGILQPPGVEDFLSSAPEAPHLTGAPVPDLGSAPLLDSEGADPSSDGMALLAPEQETANVTPEGNTSQKQRDLARPWRDRRLRSRVRPPEWLF